MPKPAFLGRGQTPLEIIGMSVVCSRQRSSFQQSQGQTPLEIIGMSVVIVGLLLLVLVTTYARNMDTQRLLLQGESNVQCGGISAAIARLYTNRATISEQLHIEKQAELKRVEGKPGGILVGGVSCSYAGTVEVDGISDTAGVTLAVGNWCLEKSDSVIEISQGECP